MLLCLVFYLLCVLFMYFYFMRMVDTVDPLCPVIFIPPPLRVGVIKR